MNNIRKKIYLTVLLLSMLTGNTVKGQTTIGGSVYGGGEEADVKTNTEVNMSGGLVNGNVYGGGKMGSVGTIASSTKTVGTTETITLPDGTSMPMTYGFVLSVPYTFTYAEDATSTETDKVTGKTAVNITGGIIGTNGKGNGDVYGAGRGQAGDSYAMAEVANVRKTTVTIGADGSSSTSVPDIKGSVYGGGENGHTIEDANVIINGGVIGHSVYGSGKGTDKYAKTLKHWEDDSEYEGQSYSITAGKVYGNTYVEMKGGLVKYNIYGGGKMASIGKGNYSGGADDYAPMGYSETIKGNLWDGVSDESKAFLNSGKATVKVTGGTVGSPSGLDDETGQPIGNVYGGSQGEPAPNIFNQPISEYNPVFHTGNIHESEVTIGAASNDDNVPRIYGSVYGGGQDGHMRRDAKVTVYSGEIGNAYTAENKAAVGTSDLNHLQWKHRGNVYGSGSGIGMYKYDYDGDGNLWTDTNGNGWYDDGEPIDTYTYNGTTYYDMGVSYLAGCVARFTEVDIRGGIIHRNVYGGGSVAGTGEPKFGGQDYEPYKKGDKTTQGKQSMNTVTISGGTIGEANYGGDVYGASRGEAALVNADDRFATAIWTEVNIEGGTINGSVYGGGELGTVKQDTEVNLKGGEIIGDAYGGGKGTSEVAADIGSTSTVTPGGNTTVKLNEGVAATTKGCIVNRIFGCNNLNGTPKGDVKVYVYATQNKNKPTDSDTQCISAKFAKHDGAEVLTGSEISTYDVAAVYGGGNLSPYVPREDAARSEVYIEGCDLTSIKQVYGGGNAAPAPGTLVRVNGAYEIEEVFGGGNGKDDYELNGKYYKNPGANVGYKNYTQLEGTGDGTQANPYNCVEKSDASTPEDRLAYGYGSGIATTEIIGGRIHYVYGGSNEKGNIRVKAKSVYEELDETCPIQTDETYGGGKNSIIDGAIDMGLGCVNNMDMTFGGSKNADVNSDIVLNITNGTYQKVFGGNNTSGAINGSITVNIKEEGCSPIRIGELYAGGYLAPYSVYGYKQTTDGVYDEEDVPYIDDEGNTQSLKQRIPLTSGTKKSDPRINVISATRIDNIYGGGYQATVVGCPHVNVNMEEGHIANKYIAYIEDSEENPLIGTHKDPLKRPYYDYEITSVEDGGDGTPKGGDAILAVGTIGNIYGGGNMADIKGDTYVEIGTGTVHNVEGDGFEAITPARNAANITGDVFGGGKGVEDDVTKAKLQGNSNITMANGTVKKSIYGGGELACVDGNTNITVSGGAIGDETNTKGGAEIGNVYGGGKGSTSNVSAGLIKGNTNVTISGGSVYHNIYGGGAYGSVGDITYGSATYVPGKESVANMPTGWAEGAGTEDGNGLATITVTGGIIGINGDENGMVFGSSRGDVATPAADGVDVNDRLAWVYDTHVIVGTSGSTEGPHIKGTVYGSGENGHTYNNTLLDIYSGKIGITENDALGGANYGYRGNVYGGGCGTDMYDSDGDKELDTYNPLAGIVRGNTEINIAGGQIVHNVYGAGAMGSVGTAIDANSGKTEINITGGRIGDDGIDDGNVYGAARGDLNATGANLAQVKETKVTIEYSTTPTSDNESKTEKLIAGSVFGGGEAGIVKGNVEVNMKGGLVLHDLYGGGALAHTNTDNWNTATNNWATGKYSASDHSTTYKTNVTLKGGTVNRNVYGGGLGRKAQENVTPVEAKVYGDVLVKLNENTATDTCVVKENIFGCNNQNGSPQSAVTVHVYKTQGWDGHDVSAGKGDDSVEKTGSTYELAAVYGGGNQAAFKPDLAAVIDTVQPRVIIDGCDLTSIRQVYGGGNAASTPATNVTINSAYEIHEVFGGGNGSGTMEDDSLNPGANVGYTAYPTSYDPPASSVAERTTNFGYGSGVASVNIYGGRIHNIFGGSNTKGNVRQTAVTILDNKNPSCDLMIDEVYGGGKSAPMDAEAKLLMSCVPDLKVVYGGAQDADIQNDVVLNITNGTFDRVFGGNNVSGTISGTITVNIEETGCKEVVIGQLYGGGNQAPYTAPWIDDTDHSKGRKPGPTVNVKSFTSIGEVYGGGYGSTAIVTGDTYVNINECKGKFASTAYTENTKTFNFNEYRRQEGVGEASFVKDEETGEKIIDKQTMTVLLPGREADKIGAINNVFGGGNAAKVVGNTNVNIGTNTTVTYLTDDTDTKDVDERETPQTVVGADIRGNVYGGGNQAEVTGDTNVVIGKRAE